MVASQLLLVRAPVYRFFASQPHQITVVLLVFNTCFYVIFDPLKSMRIIGVKQAPL